MGTNQKTREQAKEQASSHHHHDHKLPNKYLDGKDTEQTRAKEYKVEGQWCDFAPTLMIPLSSVRDGMSLLLIVRDVVLVLSFINVVKDDVVYVMTICESVVKVQHTWDLQMRTLIYSNSIQIHKQILQIEATYASIELMKQVWHKQAPPKQ